MILYIYTYIWCACFCSALYIIKFPLYYPAPHDGCVANNGIAPFLSLEVLVKSCQINIPIDSYYSPISCPQVSLVSLFHVPKVVKPNKKLGLGLVVLVLWTSKSLKLHPSPGLNLAGPPWKTRRKRRLGPARTFPLGGGEPHRKGGRCQMATNTSGGRREGQLQYNLQYIERYWK